MCLGRCCKAPATKEGDGLGFKYGFLHVAWGGPSWSFALHVAFKHRFAHCFLHSTESKVAAIANGCLLMGLSAGPRERRNFGFKGNKLYGCQSDHVCVVWRAWALRLVRCVPELR